MIRHLRTYSRLPLAALLLAAAACSDATAPIPLDIAGMETDLLAAETAVSSQATVSFAGLGGSMDLALEGMGGGSAMLDLPAALLTDPQAIATRRELRERTRNELGTASIIPLGALGKTFVYDVDLNAYVVSDLEGAPGNGVRFLLYAVDPATKVIVEPLVETGYADITRTATNTSATARVEVFSTALANPKVLDYSTTVSGPVVSPSVTVTGFARNGTDSLAFDMVSTLDFANQRIELVWEASVPSRGVGTSVLTTLTGGANPNVILNGRIVGPHGAVRLAGQIFDATGGTLTVRVNGEVFATIAVENADDETVVVLGADGQPLSAEETAMLELMLTWFRGVFDFFRDLLRPVQFMLAIAL